MNEQAAKEIYQWEKTSHPSQDGMVDAFAYEMFGKLYGYEETMEAWHWFQQGWVSCNEKGK